ncbi:MAG TPA: hypothetical protein VMI47_14360 [Pseudolabrys sp.]|nr:hypothetical protein [Pseudolabrys sp.]
MAMARRQSDNHQGDAVVAAIERVLKSEREGAEALRKTADDAQRLLSETRAQAAALARRADICISKLHTAYLRKIERDIKALTQAHMASGEQAGKPYDTAVLAAAARRLAAKLTGGA